MKYVSEVSPMNLEMVLVAMGMTIEQAKVVADSASKNHPEAPSWCITVFDDSGLFADSAADLSSLSKHDWAWRTETNAKCVPVLGSAEVGTRTHREYTDGWTSSPPEESRVRTTFDKSEVVVVLKKTAFKDNEWGSDGSVKRDEEGTDYDILVWMGAESTRIETVNRTLSAVMAALVALDMSGEEKAMARKSFELALTQKPQGDRF